MQPSKSNPYPRAYFCLTHFNIIPSAPRFPQLISSLRASRLRLFTWYVRQGGVTQLLLSQRYNYFHACTRNIIFLCNHQPAEACPSGNQCNEYCTNLVKRLYAGRHLFKTISSTDICSFKGPHRRKNQAFLT
jgi:hypothetical protein